MICTPAEVATHAGRASLTTAEEAATTAQIALYQAELDALLGRAVERAVRTESLVTHRQRFYVAYGPIHAVTAVSVGARSLTTGHYAVGRDWIELFGWYSVGADAATLSVTYDGGWEAPRNLPAKNAVMARTARWLNKRTDDDVGTETSSVEGHSVKWMPDAFTPAELTACQHLRAPDMAG